MSFRFKFIALLTVSFSFGILVWKYSKLDKDRNKEPIVELSKNSKSVILKVDGKGVTQGDLDFEYDLHTLGIVDKSDLTPIPNLGGNIDQELSKLKYELLGGIVERKVLYQYIVQDKIFFPTIKENLQECVATWQKALHANIKLLHNEKNQLRLKVRVCEQSTLNRYMKERLFPNIEVKEEEIVEYYKNHHQEFNHPKMVTIRQIVLGSEGKAKRVRNKSTRRNFAALAKEYSITPESENGGLIGPYKKGELPPVFDIAFRLRRGDISSIQKSTYGFHIIKVEKKIKKREIGLEEARKEIQAALYELKKDEEYKKWVELALHSIHVETTQPLW